MKHKLYHWYDEDYDTEVFWDENKKIITFICYDDGAYRDEYMDCLFKHFGVEPIIVEDRPHWLTKKKLIELGVEFE